VAASRVEVGLLALAVASCGRVGLDPVPRLDPAPKAPDIDASVDTPIDAAIADAPGETSPMPAPPFATILRVVNVGAADVKLYRTPSYACPFGFLIQGEAPLDQPTSIESPDTICDCGDCAKTPGRRNCSFFDGICDDPPLVIAPGSHFDFGWDGTAMIWLSPAPAASQCIGACSEFFAAPAGNYTFTLEQWTRSTTVQAALPAPGGVIEIPVGD